MPSAYAAAGATSARFWQPSSTMTGRRGWRSFRALKESMSAAGKGCSTNSTPSRISSGMRSRAASSVQPSFASTRIVASGASARTASSRSRSSAPPTLTLSARNSRARRTRSRVPSTVSMPIVNEVCGARGERPSSRHSGTPSRLPIQSCKRTVERGLATGQAIHVLEPLLDVLERERIVADERWSGRARGTRRRHRWTRRGNRRRTPRRARPLPRARARPARRSDSSASRARCRTPRRGRAPGGGAQLHGRQHERRIKRGPCRPMRLYDA